MQISSERTHLDGLHAAANGTGSTLADPRKRSRDVSESNVTWRQLPTPISVPGMDNRASSGTRSSSILSTNPWTRTNLNNLHPSNQDLNCRDASRVNPSARTIVSTSSSFSSSHVGKPPTSKKPRLDTTARAAAANRRQGTDTSSFQVSSSISMQEVNRRKSGPSVTAQDNTDMDIIFANGASLSKIGDRATKRRKSTQSDPVLMSSSHRSHDVIDVDEEVPEEFPVHARSDSSDEMALRPGSTKTSTTTTVNQVLDVRDPPPPWHPPNQKQETRSTTPPPSGPRTIALKAKLANRGFSHGAGNEEESSDDPIQDADGFDSATTQVAVSSKRSSIPIEIPESQVNKKIELFENLRFDRLPPQVDLLAKAKEKQGSSSRVASMKGKSSNAKVESLVSGPKSVNAHSLDKPPSALRGARKQADHIATSSTHFKPKGPRVDGAIMLPIEIWAMGDRIIQSLTEEAPHPLYWLGVQGKRIAILAHPIAKRNSVFDFELPADIQNAELPRDDGVTRKLPLLVFNLKENERTKLLFMTTDGFNKGNRGIAIKLLTSHPNWSIPTYKEIEKLIKGQVGVAYLTVPAIEARWETVQRAHSDNISEDAQATTISQAIRGRPKPRPTYAGANNSSTKPDNSFHPLRSIRRSTRHISSAIQQPDRSPSPPADETILFYPPTGTGAVNVTHGDLKRLEPGEYLNDTLIEFGLKLWLNDLRIQRPEFADQVHVFSSFFYTQLNQKNLEEGYRSVRKWTSRFDLFKKKYIVVPINEHLHWYLAIICNPERALQQPQNVTSNIMTRTKLRDSFGEASLRPRPDSETTTPLPSPPPPQRILPVSPLGAMEEQEVETLVRSFYPNLRQRAPASPSSSLTAQSDGEIIPRTPSESDDNDKTGPLGEDMEVDGTGPADEAMEGSPRPAHQPGSISTSAFYASPEPMSIRIQDKRLETEENEEDDDELDQLDNDHAMDIDISAPPLESMVLSKPYIFSFDSLGARHPHALKVLSRYLDLEASDKKGFTETVQAVTKQASVPAQPNYCDCGVYLLHFVEQFMSEPEAFVRHVTDHKKSRKTSESNKMSREQVWRHHLVADRRENLKQRLLSLSSEWKQEKDAEGQRKGKEVEDGTSVTRAKSIVIDDDSEIEVLDRSPRSSKPARVPRPRAARLRG